jgi:hypothetical protein
LTPKASKRRASLEPPGYLPDEFHDFRRDQLDRSDEKQDQSR